MRILLLVAMEKEIQHALPESEMERASIQLPNWLQTTVYHQQINQSDIFLVTGAKDPIHKVDALGSAILPTATLAIHFFQPDLVINGGSAGGAGLMGCKTGEVFLCEGPVSFHDQLLYPDVVHMPYRVGSYPLLDVLPLAKSLNIKTARISIACRYSGSKTIFRK